VAARLLKFLPTDGKLGDRAFELLRMHGTVENVIELLTGMMAEKPSAGDALPMAEVMTNSFIINAILSNNHIVKNNSWVSDTFSGVEFPTWSNLPA